MQRYTRIVTGALALMLVCLTGSALLAVEPHMRDRPNANDVGIWKSYAPHGLKGELNNYDPIGLIAGALIHADCSINWVDPDNGKIYCFASGTSLNYFQDWPKTYSRRASEALEKMEKDRPDS